MNKKAATKYFVMFSEIEKKIGVSSLIKFSNWNTNAFGTESDSTDSETDDRAIKLCKMTDPLNCVGVALRRCSRQGVRLRLKSLWFEFHFSNSKA